MPYDVLDTRGGLQRPTAIASGATHSDAVSMLGRPILGLIVPAMNGTGPTVTPEVSLDGSNWYSVWDQDGATEALEITAGVSAFAVNSEDLAPLSGYVAKDVWIRLVSSVAQTAERAFTWLTIG